jgi:DNA invertase Pin-like site-specific DNA recombinase
MNQPSPATTSKRAAVYARVSTDGQETTNQLLQMARFVESQGWERREFVDHQSGKSAQRPQLQALFAAAARREVDVVVFWSLDRFTREGALATLQHLALLGSYGVRFRSFAEPYLDSCGLWGDAIIAILGTIAKQERVRIVERVKAGLDRARTVGTRSGAPIGRPPAIFDRAQVVQRRARGESWRHIARALSVSTRTARRVYEQGSVAKPLIKETAAGGAMKRVASA